MRTTEKVEKNKNTKIDNFFMDSESESLINSSSSNEISYDRNISDSEGDSLLNYDESDNENDNLDDNIEMTNVYGSVKRNKKRYKNNNKKNISPNDTWVDDAKGVLCDAWYVGSIGMAIGFIIAVFITIAPYYFKLHWNDFMNEAQHPKTIDDLRKIRPVLNKDEQLRVMKDTMYAETQFWMPDYDRVKIRFHTKSDKEGTIAPPDMFYEGVTYGVTSYNSHDIEFASYTGDNAFDELGEALNKMKPSPTHILRRSAVNNATQWMEPGYAVHFNYDDLKKQGKLSSDPFQPWKRMEDNIVEIMRRFRQPIVFRWHPNRFGKVVKNDKKKHVSIIQDVFSTHTGLDGVKSSCVVWMSAINSSLVQRHRDVISKPWTKDDHWSKWVIPDSKIETDSKVVGKSKGTNSVVEL